MCLQHSQEILLGVALTCQLSWLEALHSAECGQYCEKPQRNTWFFAIYLGPEIPGKCTPTAFPGQRRFEYLGTTFQKIHSSRMIIRTMKDGKEWPTNYIAFIPHCILQPRANVGSQPDSCLQGPRLISHPYPLQRRPTTIQTGTVHSHSRYEYQSIVGHDQVRSYAIQMHL